MQTWSFMCVNYCYAVCKHPCVPFPGYVRGLLTHLEKPSCAASWCYNIGSSVCARVWVEASLKWSFLAYFWFLLLTEWAEIETQREDHVSSGRG